MEDVNNALMTKRMVIGQVTVCSGCCCGAVHRGKPEVPIEWLKQEWRKRGILKKVQLTVSNCLGPCDLPNVVRISDAGRDTWLGKVERIEQYQALVDWAAESMVAGTCLPLPEQFEFIRFNPFREQGIDNAAA
jgi:cobaltochelatase CobN